MTDQLERTRAKRGGHRGVCTKLQNELQELLHLEETTAEEIARIETIKAILEDKSKVLDTLDEVILDICEVGDIEHEIDESTEVTRRILQSLATIEKFQLRRNAKSTTKNSVKENEASEDEIDESEIGNVPNEELESNITNVATNQANTGSTTSKTGSTTSNTKENTNATAANIEHESTTNQITIPCNKGMNTTLQEGYDNMKQLKNTNEHTIKQQGTFNIKAKLPKLTLPKFKGEVTKWNTFWDSFNSAIHSDVGISKIDKLNYFNSLLEGTAARAIQGLPITNENYEHAIEFLIERFGRPQQIISAHMDEILKIPSANGERIAPLRFIYDKVSVHVRGLASLGVSAEQYGSLLIPIIMSKLPAEIKLQIARKSSNKVWNIEELLDTIKIELEAREVSEGSCITNTTTRIAMGQQKGKPTASTLTVNNESSNKPQCVYCNGRHYSASCESVKDTERRKAILKESRRCFICLSKSHISPNCPNNKKCRRCQGKHHQSICTGGHNSNISIPTTSTTTQVNNTQHMEEKATTTASGLNKGTVLLQTASAIASNSTRSANVRVLFDTGSQRSYITTNLANRLKLQPIGKENLHLNTFGESKYKRQTCEVYKLSLQGRQNSYNEQVQLTAIKFPVICTPLRPPTRMDYPHLQGLQFADYELDSEYNTTIDVLIGADHYWDFVTGDTITGDYGPTAVSSKLGWLVSGYSEGSSDGVISNLVISGDNPADYVDESDELINSLQQFWETESIGIADEGTTKQDTEDSREFIRNIRFTGERYEVGLPWKESFSTKVDINDFELCNKRLISLHNKLKKDRDLLLQYDTAIKEQLANGIIERVNKEDNESNTKVHYLPHHCVVKHDRETTKLRVVYDGSAKPPTRNYSINDCLLTGPNLIPHIFDILIRFRINPIGLVADIEKAFLMISIAKEDRDMLRFLWFDNCNSPNPRIIEYRFCRLVFGLRPSPAILGSTIKYHLEQYRKKNPTAVETIASSLYVDDFVSGAKDEEKGFTVYKNSKEILQAGGFNLRKWNTNSQGLRNTIANEENKHAGVTTSTTTSKVQHSYEAKKETVEIGSQSQSKNAKILGVEWDTESDEFKFNFEELIEYAKSLPPTKRSVLKVTSKVFDPVGFLSPFTTRLKSLFQELCKTKVAWDDELEGTPKRIWDNFASQLSSLNEIKFQRCYFDKNKTPTVIELHGFSDASELAFAATVYLRVIYDNGDVSVRLIASKSKVAPIKKQTIPRLELLGATILARLVNKVTQSMPQLSESKFLWVDSTTTLCWIVNERHWKQYVQHRVEEIRKLTNKEYWRYCPGKENPADLPSRRLSAKDLASCAIWWNGPEFLYLRESQWPRSLFVNDNDSTAMEEIVIIRPEVTHSLTTTSKEFSVTDVSQVIYCERFSSLKQLLRVTAYVLRFINRFKKREATNDNKELTAQEIRIAETLWIKSVQSSAFPKELEFLCTRNTSSPM